MIAFQVADMSCAHCERAITEAVRGVLPDVAVTVDLGAQRVAVAAATEASAGALAAAIRDAGYTPERVA